jgi:hypothetical protein
VFSIIRSSRFWSFAEKKSLSRNPNSRRRLSLAAHAVPYGSPALPSGGLAGTSRERGGPISFVGLIYPSRFGFQRHQQGGGEDDAME